MSTTVTRHQVQSVRDTGEKLFAACHVIDMLEKHLASMDTGPAPRDTAAIGAVQTIRAQVWALAQDLEDLHYDMVEGAAARAEASA